MLWSTVDCFCLLNINFLLSRTFATAGMRSAFISSLKEEDLVMINTHGGGCQANHHNHHESSILSWKWHICEYSSTFSTVPVKWMCGVQLCRKASQLFLTYHRHHHRHRSQNSEFRKCLFDQNDLTLWFNNVTNTGPNYLLGVYPLDTETTKSLENVCLQWSLTENRDTQVAPNDL